MPTLHREWIPVDASKPRTTGPNTGARTRANKLRRLQTMGDRTDFAPMIVPGTETEFLGPTRPLKDKHRTPTAIETTKTATTKKTLKFVKNCGDCEPGGWGSTYGFSPR
jgi:hypothetical protein